ncbi:MAG: hypothetical protein ACXVW4_08275 [Nocardioides sp.]
MAQGKRSGARRGPKKQASVQPALLGLALGVTLCVVAWGYLVYAAIDFGSTARGGESTAWYFLALASVGAVACLFVGLMLVARLLRRLGITRGPQATHDPGPSRADTGTETRELPPLTLPLGEATSRTHPAPRQPGGGRAAR